MNKTKRSSLQPKPNKKYFRLIESDLFDSKPTERGHPLAAVDQLSKHMGRDRKYLYIDLNDDKGFNLMQQCSESQPDEEAEQLGNNFVSQLEFSSSQNTKATAYWLLAKKDRHKNGNILNKMERSLKRSREQLAKSRVNNSSRFSQYDQEKERRPQVYRGMDITLLDQIRSKEEYEELSKLVKARESTLSEKSRVFPKKDLKIYERSSELRLNSFLPSLSTISSLKA